MDARVRIPRSPSRSGAVVLGSLLLLSVATGAGAQAPGAIVGRITDESGIGLYGVEIALEDRDVRASTDEAGTFRLTGVSPGPAVVRARRLGFEPQRIEVVVGSGESASLAVKLRPLPQTLAPVTVRTKRVDRYGRLAGFYERLEQRSGGYFITRYDIEQQQPRMLGHVLQRVPGVTLVRGRAGTTGVRLRGRRCWPLVWLDGLPMSAGDVDIDSFSPYGIEGLELYLGSTGPPLRYTAMNDGSSCGTILLWTRSSELEPKVPRSRVDELQRLIAASSIFTAEEVDSAARLDPARVVPVSYPPSLFAAGVKGLVLAEFVVDTLGRVELSTIGVVSSTHPAFAHAVREALPAASYTPAQRGGRRVRQLVYQPFDFAPTSSRARQ
jgi:TonB family protein